MKTGRRQQTGLEAAHSEERSAALCLLGGGTSVCIRIPELCFFFFMVQMSRQWHSREMPVLCISVGGRIDLYFSSGMSLFFSIALESKEMDTLQNISFWSGFLH